MNETRKCMSCGFKEMVRRENLSETITYGNESVTLQGLSGWFCPACNDGYFDESDHLRYSRAGDDLVTRARQKIKEEVRRIRKKLGLTQKEAALIFGGGVNAFSRYERGEIEPHTSTRHLLRLLDKHPEMLDEIRKAA